jgi:hypothetical protein
MPARYRQLRLHAEGVKDMKSYQDFIVNKLASLANIGNAQSQFVLYHQRINRLTPNLSGQNCSRIQLYPITKQ